MEENEISLGGSIRLSGFGVVDGGSMIVIKKIVGSFVKKASDRDPKFQSLSLHLKKVHGNVEREESGKYEIRASMIGEKHCNSEVVDQNLMFALDKALKKIESEMD
jgi:hypothetical protein